MADKKKRKPGSSKGMKAIAVLNIVSILAVVFTVAAALVILPRETVSHEENRTLAKFPEFTLESYLKGDYTEGIADYYDDTVPHRSDIKSLVATYILPNKGVKYGEDSIEIFGNVPAKPQRNRPQPSRLLLSPRSQRLREQARQQRRQQLYPSPLSPTAMSLPQRAKYRTA